MALVYDVFLSFRGEDTRKTFTDHLYTALVNAGFRTFRDDPELERGENIKQKLEKAIQQSRSSVIVFSKDYTSSRWCLDELVILLERMRTSDHVVLPVFYEVEPSEVRKQAENLAKVPKYQENQSSEKLNGWRAALREVADLAGIILQNGHESKFIQNIVGVIQDKLGRRVPLDVVQDKLQNKLLYVNHVLDHAEGKQLNNTTVMNWLNDLKEAVYDAEDLLQEIKTEALRQKMEPEYPWSSTSTVQELVSRPASHAFDSASIISKVEEVLERLNFITKERKDVMGLDASAGHKESQTLPTTEGEWKSILNSEMWELPHVGSNILQSLWLSYMHLPSHLKRCFAYCSLFPKNYKFQKSELVFLWMAEDLLQPQKEETAEEIGNGYFNDLISMSFLQLSSSYRNAQHFIMHDLINDLASFVSREFCFRWEGSDSSNNLSKIRHLSCMIKYDDDDYKFEALHQAKYLRTFLPLALCRSIKWSGRGLHEVLPNLQCLRMLKLSGSNIEELPDSVNNLKHLRHLDMSYSSIKKLPDTICTLYNLQALLLLGCYNLTELPPNFGRLIKLTHVDVEGTMLIKMPPHMGNLKDLQVLTKFVLDKHTAGDNLIVLKKLQNLRGKLEISGLEHGSGLEADILMDKKLLNKVSFNWGCVRLGEEDNALEVLEKLEPNPDLERLTIDGYGGEMFPGWLRYSSSPALVNLKLSECVNCKSLPPLGQLPSLRKLHISALRGVVSIGHEFYSSANKPFRSLESLTFQWMSGWEVWSHEGSLFPNLRVLHLWGCPKLGGRLALDSFPMLKEVVLEGIGFSHLTSSQECPELVMLKLSECPNLGSFPDGGLHAPNLTDIGITDCGKLGSWPEQMHTLLPSLEDLWVSNCPELESFPEGGLPAQLKSLGIEDCKKFNSNSLQNLNKGLRSLTSLEALALDFDGCEEVDSFPEETLLPNTLTSLCIYCLKLKTMDGAKWFGHLNSLITLKIRSCFALQCLPGLPSSLCLLRIYACPLLKNWCRRQKWEDSPKIAHILQIEIDGQLLTHAFDFALINSGVEEALNKQEVMVKKKKKVLGLEASAMQSKHMDHPPSKRRRINMDWLTTQQASFSSSSSTRSWTHDVFLSFRGEDTCFNFTDHLHNNLVQNGINTFRDDELTRGEEISQALLEAIQRSKSSLIVFSENYASSKWCLDELVHILECKRSNQQKVWPVFYKVDPSDVRHQRGSFGDALADHEINFEGNMERVKRWRAALSEAANLSGWHFSDGYESKFIHEVVEEISLQVKEHTYLNVVNHQVGLESRVQHVLERLDVGGSDIRMVGIWGIGGIGKTTIAKAVFNSIAHKFECSCFLANVKEKSEVHGGLLNLQNILLSKIVGGKELKVINVDEGITLLRERLRHKRILLVLDDVNKLDQLDKLAGATDWFGRGSKIIITTRDNHLLIAHQVSPIYKARELDPHESRELFSLNVFKNKTNLDDNEELLVNNVVEYAQGLPLALEILGSHLCCIPIHQWQAEFSISRRLEGFKIFQNLTSINFESCQFLKEFPDVSGLPNLRILNLDYCTSLVKIDDSVGFLEKLVDLSLSGCHNLVMFPRRIALKSVEHINVRGCRRLETLPEIVGEMESLTWLDLSGTAIKDLPSSIGDLVNLEELIMEECENLTNLPCCIYELQHLWCLDLQYCSKLVMLPRWNAESLPTKSTKSPDLWYLNLRGCKRLREIHELPPKVQWLNAADCVQLESFAVLSNILKHKESKMIKCLVLSNCQRLCDSLTLDVATIGRNILNEVSLCSLFLSCAQSEFEVVFPGNEIPRWFSHHKQLNFLETSKLSFEIPLSFKWRNKGLAICAAVAVGTTTPKEKNVMQSNLGNFTFTAEIDINGESTVARSFSFEAKDMVLAHVWLCYIPFIVFAYRQLPPFTCGVRVEHTSQGSVRCKSYGVHIVIPQNEDEDADSEGLEDEDIKNNMK